MFKDQKPRVQTETPRRIRAGAITLIAGYRMMIGGELGSDLMFSARFQREFHERVIFVSGKQSPAGDSAQRSGRSGVGLPYRACPVLRQPRVVGAGIAGHASLDQRDINPLLHKLVPIVHQGFFCLRMFGKYHDAGGIAVQTMDKRGPAVRVRPFDMVADKVVQRFFAGTSPRDNGEAGRLVDGNNVAVFIKKFDAPVPIHTKIVPRCRVERQLVGSYVTPPEPLAKRRRIC